MNFQNSFEKMMNVPEEEKKALGSNKKIFRSGTFTDITRDELDKIVNSPIHISSIKGATKGVKSRLQNSAQNRRL